LLALDRSLRRRARLVRPHRSKPNRKDMNPLHRFYNNCSSRSPSLFSPAMLREPPCRFENCIAADIGSKWSVGDKSGMLDGNLKAGGR
jgi:hypothetical protein